MNALPTQEEIREHKIREEISNEWLKWAAEANHIRRKIMEKILKDHGLDDTEIEQVFKEFDVEAEKMLELELTAEKLQKDWEAIIERVEAKRRKEGHISFKSR